MAGTNSIDELELNSQVQLLSRVQFLMRFSSNLIQILGAEGAGKTWLSECYLEKWATEPTQALLLCNANQRDEQHRAIILRQLVKDGVFNEQDTLVQSLNNMLRDEAIHGLIVIDDADLLSNNLAKELWQLVCVAQERVGWQINVLVFATPSRLSKYFSKLGKNQEEKPIEIEITSLNESERELLTTAIVKSFQMDGAGRRSFKLRSQNVPSLPGAIIDCAYPKLGSDTVKKSRSMFIPITVTLLLLVLGATLIFWLQIPKGMSPGQYLAQLWSQFSGDTAQKNKVDINSLAKEDSVELPAQTFDNNKQVGRSDTNGTQSVVVDSDTVDAMLNEQNDDEDLIGGSVFSDTVQVGDADPNQGLKITQLPDPFDSSAQELINSLPSDERLANQMLLTVPSSRYALQLGAFQTQTELKQFIAQHDLKGRVLVYQTLRAGSPWYMVLLGDYPSVVEARRTELSLPQALRNLGPWAKSFTQIHREISLVQ